MPIISKTKIEKSFFEQLEREYKQTPRDQRAEFIDKSVREFQKQANDLRDKVSSIEIGEDAEGKFDINYSEASYVRKLGHH